MIDVIARGMIEESNGDISQISEKVNNHTEDSDIHVTVTDKENWNSHPNDVTASGNPVVMDNLQGGVPFSEMVVSGKNLLQKMVSKTIGGLNYSTNDDGSVSVTGTQTAENYPNITSVTGMLLKAGKYTLSGGTERLQITALDVDANAVIARSKIDPATFSIDNDKYVRIYVYSAGAYNGQTFDDVIYPQLEIGTTPTAYEPPITGRDLTVNVSGKNLLPAMSNSVTRNGITYTVNADGTITLNGTAEKADSVDVVYKMPLKAGVYTLSGCPEGGSGITFALRAGLGTANTLYGRDYGNGLKITADTDTVLTVTIQNAEVGRVFDNVVFRPQLEIGSAATEYEPYSGAEYTITPDSSPYIIPNDIRQQDGLNNISVSNGKISVTGVRKNKAIKRIWDKLDELTTAIIVSGGETE